MRLIPESVCALLLLTAGFAAGGSGSPQETERPKDDRFTTYATAQIELVDQKHMEVDGKSYTLKYYVNKTYACAPLNARAKARGGFESFVIAYPKDLPPNEERPLWVRMHGDHDPWGQEDFQFLAGHLEETGLIKSVREHPAGFRFLIPSQCSLDRYSGIGASQEEPAFGLFSTQAAIAYARHEHATSHIFLHGTSGGAMGSISVAFALERKGTTLSGIISDSGLWSGAMLNW